MNDYKNLLAYPITEEIGYREKIDPKKLNLIINSLEESIMRAMLRSADTKKKCDTLSLAVIKSYEAMAARVNQISSTGNDFSLYATAYNDVIVSENSKINQNKIAGIITLDWEAGRKFSKIPNVDDILSPAIQIYVDGELRDSEDEVYNILKRQKDIFWLESVDVNLPKEHVIEIHLPPSLNKKINNLDISPFPAFGIFIKKIELIDLHSNPIEIFSNEKEAYSFYNNSGPMSLHFNPIEYNNTIKITYEITKSDSDPVMGFSNISLNYIDYINTCTFYIPFENIPDESEVDILMQSLELDYYIDSNVTINHSNFINLSIVKDITDTDGIDITNIDSKIELNDRALKIENGNLFLKVILIENNYTTPIIRGARLIYDRSE